MNENARGDNKKSYLVLSIDGGGFRGLACLLILAHLMTEISCENDKDTPPRPCQIFDLICGTSTGGLIAILLGRFGLSSSEAIEVYREIGATMFGGETDPAKIWEKIIEEGPLPSATFEKKLEDLIGKYTGSKETLFRSRGVPDSVDHDSTKTFVTVVSKLGAAGVDAYRIRSYPRAPYDVDPAPYGHEWTIFEAARGTCADPLYMSPLKIQCGHATFTFQDASCSGFNNPARAALDEAESLYGPKATIILVSVGTGLRSLIDGGQQVKAEHINTFAQQLLADVGRPGRSARDASQGAKRLAKQLLEVATDTEVSHLRVYERFRRQGLRQNYHRFNPPQGLGDVGLTDYKQEDAISSITNAWLKSPAGRAAVSSVIKILKCHWDLKLKQASNTHSLPLAD